MEFAAGCLRVAQECFGARKGVTIFKSGNRRLASAHSGSEFGLGQACTQASPEQLGRDFEFRSERIVLGLHFGVGEQTGFQLFELDGHVMSFDALGHTFLYLNFEI